MGEMQFGSTREMIKREKIAKDFYNKLMHPDDQPIFVTDEASFYAVYTGNISEAINIIHKEYGVLFFQKELQMPFWQLLDLLYKEDNSA